MILTLDVAKQWVRVDDDDLTVQMLIDAAETYLLNATGITFDDTNNLAKVYCLVLVADWYENRELVGKAPSEKARETINSIKIQLEYCYDVPDATMTDGSTTV